MPMHQVRTMSDLPATMNPMHMGRLECLERHGYGWRVNRSFRGTVSSLATRLLGLQSYARLYADGVEYQIGGVVRVYDEVPPRWVPWCHYSWPKQREAAVP